jgi:hypothetical protein
VTIFCAITSTEAGTIAAEIAAFFLVAGVLFSLCRYLQHKYHAFSMEFAKEKPLLVGKQELLVRIKAIKGISFERIGIRFVERHGICSHWKDAPQNTILIDSLRDLEQEKEEKNTGYKLKAWSDEVGGMYAQYEPPYPRRCSDSLWLQVKLDAKKEWKGFISFEGNLEGHRRYVRNRIAVIRRVGV